jgi:predicted amidophosphoribosyltransferase
MPSVSWCCQTCGERAHNRTALYCRKCGASLVQHYETPAPSVAPNAWKSLPVLVRFGVWLIVLPPLLAFGSRAACTMLAALSAHH